MPAHDFRCTVRWADMDAFGIVNNVVYARYLEEARVDLLFGLGAENGLADLARGVVVARIEIDYRRPLTWRPEGVLVSLRTEAIGAGSFTLAYNVHDDTQTYAEARTVLVPYDFAALRPRRVSDAERAFLTRFEP